MMLRVRSAELDDLDTVVDFNRRLALESEHKTLDLELLRPGVAAMLADPAKGRYFIAELDGAVVGQLSITTEWSDWRNGWFWWFQSVYVVAEARRRGVFRTLFEHVRAAARHDPEVIGLRLYVDQSNASAHQAYFGLGMVMTEYQVMETYPL